MPFWRPLPLPRLASIHFLQRRLSTQPPLRQDGTYCDCFIVEAKMLTLASSTASITASKLATSPPPPPASSRTAQPLAVKPPPPLAYHVHRTASQQLPIYQLAKRGGNLHQTRIRKIEGDAESLRNEIRTALELKEELVVINRLTGHIIIKVRGDTGRKPHGCGLDYIPGVWKTGTGS